MTRLFATTATLLLVCIPALAQPQATTILNPPTREQLRVPKVPPTPAQNVESVVRNFVSTLNSRNPYLGAAQYVTGIQDFGYFGGPEWGDAWTKQRGNSQLWIEKVEVTDLTPASAVAHVAYGWRSISPRFRSQTINENLNLRFATPPLPGAEPQWKILPVIPKTAEEAKALGIELPVPDENGRLKPLDTPPVLNELVQNIADPKTAWARQSGADSTSNLKQLALAALQFTQDYDEKIAFAPEFYKNALKPYTREIDVLVIPATGEPYAFNGNLSGKFLEQIKSPAQTVLFYEGQNQIPVYRYNGRAAIGYMDGHVQMVTPEQAQSLIWVP